MKTIIIATDYSKAADIAVAYGAELARTLGFKVILFNALHVPEPHSYTPYPNFPALAVSVQELLTQNKEKLMKLAVELELKHNIMVEPVTGTMDVEDEMDALVEQYNAELVVMGMQGHSAIAQKIFGSNTIALIQKAQYPVLVVPSETKNYTIERIMLASERSLISGPNRLDFLKEIALAYKAKIQVLRVHRALEKVVVGSGELTENAVTIDKVLSGVRHEYKEIESDEIIKGIDTGLSEYKPDLLVMIPHRASFWEVMLSKSNTRKMALKVHIPLLALPNPR
jgi:nucleotide-binding universal stress UspA family protein